MGFVLHYKLASSGGSSAGAGPSASGGQLSLRDACNARGQVGRDNPYGAADQVKNAQYELDHLASIHTNDAKLEADNQALLVADRAIVAAGSVQALSAAFDQAANANNSLAVDCG